MSDGGLFEHSDGLAALRRGAQRLAIEQGRVGVLGIGAIALAVNIRRRSASGPVSAFGDNDPVTSDMAVWQPPRPTAKIAATAADARSRATLDCWRIEL
jgi:hypothetical protein